MEEIIKAVEKFLRRFNQQEIEGVLLYGSVVSGKINKNSDIDLIVAINTNESIQSVGCSIIDGYKIEYFIHNINNVYEEALKQIEKNDVSHLTKFITSKVIYDKNGKFSKQVKKIRELYNLPIRECHDNKIKKEIFHIKNRIDDLHSLKDSDSFNIVYYDVLIKIRDLNTKINGYIIIPLAKTEKLFKDKNYMKEYIKSEIHKVPTKEFVDKYLECLKLDTNDKMIYNIEELFKITFKNENFNPDEFKLDFDIEDGFGI